jgi:hypothetical protein
MVYLLISIAILAYLLIGTLIAGMLWANGAIECATAILFWPAWVVIAICAEIVTRTYKLGKWLS